MPEYPIVIHEEYGNEFGFRLSHVNDAALQVSIHVMDQRPGRRRLTVQQVFARNVGLHTIYPVNAWEDTIGFQAGWRAFEQNERTVNPARIVNPDAWDRAVVACQQYLDVNPWSGDELLAMCPERCGIPLERHGRTAEHYTCSNPECASPRTRRAQSLYLYEYGITDGVETTYYLCRDCSPTVSFTDFIEEPQCEDCATFTDECQPFSTQNGTFMMCESCRDNYGNCPNCGVVVHDEDAYEDGYCGDCHVDNDDYDEDEESDVIHHWNYRPSLIFHPTMPVNPLKPLYMGMELELSWPGEYSLRKLWLEEVRDDYADILYVKSDSSVREGFEVVTHPMSPEWAMENFPFDLFSRAIRDGALHTHESTGTHVHIDKGALTTAQLWKVLQLHYRLKEFCGQVGGRGTDASYASWNVSGNDTIKANMLKIAREKGKAFGSADRYVPVNLKNEQTIELRYMRGGIKPKEIRKNIEWIKALYEFTDYINVEDVKNGVLDNHNYLMGWIMARDDMPNLQKHINKKYDLPTGMPERKTLCV